MILGANEAPVVFRLVDEVLVEAKLIDKDPFAPFAPTRFIIIAVRGIF